MEDTPLRSHSFINSCRNTVLRWFHVRKRSGRNEDDDGMMAKHWYRLQKEDLIALGLMGSMIGYYCSDVLGASVISILTSQ